MKIKDKCDNCESVVNITEDDITAKYNKGGGMASSPFFSGWFFYYICPICGDEQNIRLKESIANKVIERQ